MVRLFDAHLETGDLSEFNGTVATAGNSISVVESPVKAGTYAMKCDANLTTYQNCQGYYNISGQSSFYARAYFYISSHGVVGAGDYLSFIRVRASSTLLAHAGIKYTGSARWWLEVRNGTSYVDLYGSTVTETEGWHCIELYWLNHATTGGGRVWIDGELVIDGLGSYDTDNYGNPTVIGFGVAEADSLDGSTLLYMDEIAVDTEYIGLLDEGGEALSETVSDSLTVGSSTRNGVSKLAEDSIALGSETALTSIGYPFYADIETGDLSEFSGTYSSSGETVAASDEQAHGGTYSVKSTTDGGGGTENAYVRYDFIEPLDEVYLRAYVYVDTNGIDTNGDFIDFMRLRAGTTLLAHFGWRMVNGTLRWWVEFRNGATYVDRYYYSSVPETGRWYLVEAHWKLGIDDGGAELKVDGETLISDMDNDTNDYGNATVLALGIAETSGVTASTVYIDDIGIDVLNWLGGVSGLSQSVTDTVTVGSSTSLVSAGGGLPFSGNFETGDLSQFNANYGRISVVVSPVHAGLYAAECSGTGSYVVYDINGGAGVSDVYAAMWIRFPVMPTTESYIQLLRIYDSSWNFIGYLGMYWVNSSNKGWFIKDIGNTETFYAADITANTWYQLQVYIKNSTASNGEMRAFVNGTEIITRTGLSNTVYSSHIEFGTVNSDAAGFTSVIDDVAVSIEFVPYSETALQYVMVDDFAVDESFMNMPSVHVLDSATLGSETSLLEMADELMAVLTESVVVASTSSHAISKKLYDYVSGGLGARWGIARWGIDRWGATSWDGYTFVRDLKRTITELVSIIESVRYTYEPFFAGFEWNDFSEFNGGTIGSCYPYSLSTRHGYYCGQFVGNGSKASHTINGTINDFYMACWVCYPSLPSQQVLSIPFGSQNDWGTGARFDTQIIGSVFNAIRDGQINGLWVYFSTGGPEYNGNMHAAVYNSDLTLLAQTNERALSIPFMHTWQYFEFASPVPITGGNDYILAVHAENGGALPQVFVTGSESNRLLTQTASYGSFPDPLVPTYGDGLVSIYGDLTYTVNSYVKSAAAYNVNWEQIASIGVCNEGGIIKWWFGGFDGYQSVAAPIHAGMWYFLEVYNKRSTDGLNGEQHFYVNNVELASATSLNNTLGAGHFSFGVIESSAETDFVGLVDDCQVSRSAVTYEAMTALIHSLTEALRVTEQRLNGFMKRVENALSAYAQSSNKPVKVQTEAVAAVVSELRSLNKTEREYMALTVDELRAATVAAQDELQVNDEFYMWVNLLFAVVRDYITMASNVANTASAQIEDSLAYSDEQKKKTFKRLREYVAYSDATLRVVARTLVQSLAIADLSTSKLGGVFTDVLTVSVSKVTKAITNLSDALALASENKNATTKNTSETLAFEEERVLSSSLEAVEAVMVAARATHAMVVQLQENVDLSTGTSTKASLIKRLQEALIATEVYMRTSGKTLTELVGVNAQESTYLVKEFIEDISLEVEEARVYAKILTESISAEDEIVSYITLTLTRSVEDALGISEDMVLSTSTSTEEIVSVNEESIVAFSKHLAQEANILDSPTHGFSVQTQDAITALDEHVHKATVALTELLEAVEDKTRSIIKQVQEGGVITDEPTKAFSFDYSEDLLVNIRELEKLTKELESGLSVAEEWSKNHTSVSEEWISVGEEAKNAFAKLLSDTVAASERVQHAFVSRLTSSLQVADSAAHNFSKRVTQSLSLLAQEANKFTAPLSEELTFAAATATSVVKSISEDVSIFTSTDNVLRRYLSRAIIALSVKSRNMKLTPRRRAVDAVLKKMKIKLRRSRLEQ